MKKIIKRVIGVLVLILIIEGIWQRFAPIERPPGVLIHAEPEQNSCSAKNLGEIGGFKLTALAAYHIKARVLHTKHYYDAASSLVPYDVALGWGRMSDSAVLEKLSISQGNRFYFYEWAHEPPIPKQEIITHSANNHLIPGSDDVRSLIRGLKTGHLVELNGFLVEARKGESRPWRSSLSRSDSGNGACELFLVTKAELINPDD